MPPVDEGGELDLSGSAERDYRIHGGPSRPASIEHVVNHYDRLAADGEIYFSLIEPRLVVVLAEVVAVERDIKVAYLDLCAERPDPCRKDILLPAYHIHYHHLLR